MKHGKMEAGAFGTEPLKGDTLTEDKQLFAPFPLRAMALDLSGLQFRALACVAAHDRMSIPTGKGQGCRASNMRMSEMIGCHYSNLCTALTSLCELELLTREKLGRHTVYRVVYTDEDKSLFGNPSTPGAKAAGGSVGCQSATDPGQIGCPDFPESGSFPTEAASQYIPLNGEKDSVETGKDNSSEDARFAAHFDIAEFGNSLKRVGKQSGRKARRARMPHSDNVGGQMARLERSLNEGEKVDALSWYEWLSENTFCEENLSLNGQAMRLCDLLVEAMTPDERAQWQERYLGAAA